MDCQAGLWDRSLSRKAVFRDRHRRKTSQRTCRCLFCILSPVLPLKVWMLFQQTT